MSKQHLSLSSIMHEDGPARQVNGQYKYPSRLGSKMLPLLLLLLLPSLLASDTYEPCPAYPSTRGISATDLAADQGVQDALAKVQELWRSASSKLPTGLVGTIVFDQHTLWRGGFGKTSSRRPDRGSRRGQATW